MAAQDKWLKTGISSLRSGYSPTASPSERQIPRGGSAVITRDANTGRFVDHHQASQPARGVAAKK